MAKVEQLEQHGQQCQQQWQQQQQPEEEEEEEASCDESHTQEKTVLSNIQRWTVKGTKNSMSCTRLLCILQQSDHKPKLN